MIRTYIINHIIIPMDRSRTIWLVYLVGIILGWAGWDEKSGVLLSLLCLGLVGFAVPHGSCDFYIPSWLFNLQWEKKAKYWFTMVTVFIMAELLALAFWFSMRELSLLLFLLIMAWHWGSTDASAISKRDIRWYTLATGRGLILLGAPFAFNATEAAYWILITLDIDHSFIVSKLADTATILLITGIALELLAPLGSAFTGRIQVNQRLFMHWMETICILILFKVANPIIGFILHCFIIHSIRQSYRLTAFLPERRQYTLGTNTCCSLIYKLYRRARMGIFFGLLSFVCFCAWSISRGISFEISLFFSLLYFSGLLIPHALLGMILDFRTKRFVG